MSNGLDPHEMQTLAAYNGERSRGIAHTPEWQAAMARLQARFNAAYASPDWRPPEPMEPWRRLLRRLTGRSAS